jgi:hypothetical protein
LDIDVKSFNCGDDLPNVNNLSLFPFPFPMPPVIPELNFHPTPLVDVIHSTPKSEDDSGDSIWQFQELK